MSRPLRLPLFLALCALTSIGGLLLTTGLAEWPLLGLVGSPLLVGAFVSHPRNRVKRNRARL